MLILYSIPVLAILCPEGTLFADHLDVRQLFTHCHISTCTGDTAVMHSVCSIVCAASLALSFSAAQWELKSKGQLTFQKSCCSTTAVGLRWSLLLNQQVLARLHHTL